MLKTGNINTTRSFSMPHHEKSPEKPQYNMATPPFLDNPPPFLAKIFRPPPPFRSILDKSNPPFHEGGGGGGVKLCWE